MGHYGAKNGPIWPIIKLVEDFVRIKVPVKFERNPVKSVACIAFTTLREARPPARDKNTLKPLGLQGENELDQNSIRFLFHWICMLL